MHDHVTPEDLLGHRAWLVSLAHSLAGGAVDPDDLVQDTWLAALRRPPARGAGLRAWLRTVMRNRLREGIRRRRRLRAREQIAARSEALASTAESVARAEIHVLLSRLVLELPEHHRDVLLMRFFDGLTPVEVAARLRLPVATVRSRIRRALLALRGRLDALDRRDSLDWRLLLVPPGAGGGAERLLRPGGAAITGATIMTWKTTIGAAAILVLAVLAATSVDWSGRASRDPGVVTATSAPSRSAEAPERGRVVEPGMPDTSSASLPPRAGTAAEGDEVPVVPRVRVRGSFIADDGLVDGPIEVVLSGLRDPVGVGEMRLKSVASLQAGFDIDASSLFQIELPAEMMIVIDHPQCLTLRVRTSLEAAKEVAAGCRVVDLEMPLERASVAVGRVVDVAGRPVAGALVRGFVETDGGVRPLRGAPVSCDEVGEFRIRLPSADEHILVACASGLGPCRTSARLGIGAATDVGALVLEPGLRVRGSVVREDGTRVGGATLEASVSPDVPWFAVGPHEVVFDGDDVHNRITTSTSSDDGSFVLEALGPVRHRIAPTFDAAAYDLGAWLAVVVEPPATGVQIVVRGTPVTIVGLEAGTPAAGRTVTFFGAEFGDVLTLDAEGRCTVVCVPGATYGVSAGGDTRFERCVVEAPAPASGNGTLSFDLQPRRERRRVPVEFTGDVDEDVTDAVLQVRPVGASGDEPWRSLQVFRDEDGVHRTTEILPGHYEGVARVGARMFFALPGYFADAHVELVVPTDAALQAPLSIRLERAGRLSLALRLPDGAMVGGTCVVRDADGRSIDVMSAVRGTTRLTPARAANVLLPGRNEIAPALVPGRYTVEVTGERFRGEVFDFEVHAGRTTFAVLDVAPR